MPARPASRVFFFGERSPAGKAISGLRGVGLLARASLQGSQGLATRVLDFLFSSAAAREAKSRAETAYSKAVRGEKYKVKVT